MKILSIVTLSLGIAASLSAGASPVSTMRNYSLVQSYLHDLAQKNPQTTTFFELGQSGTGQSIDGVRIGSGPIHNLIVSTHHGNEYGATEVALAAAAEFAKNPIANQTLYIIPVLNISGFEAGNREETVVVGGSENGTADPNRDYPGPCGTSGPFHLQSTKALADFIDRENIVASATLHTYFPAVTYPWGNSAQDLSTPYDSQFIQLAQAATEISQYRIGNSTQVIYAADGSYEDYAYWKFGIWSLLFEIGDTHTPDDDQLADLDRVNIPGLRKMMETAPTTRAPDSAFRGGCDTRLGRLFDRHDE